MSVFWCSVVYFVIKIWISFSKIFRNKEQVNVVLFSITDYAIQCFMFNTKYDNIIAHSRYCLSSHSRNRETRGGVCVCVFPRTPPPPLRSLCPKKCETKSEQQVTEPSYFKTQYSTTSTGPWK